ncbi:MAG: nucleotide exchange factor GrpE [Candidatus Nanohalobium sp.]
MNYENLSREELIEALEEMEERAIDAEETAEEWEEAAKKAKADFENYRKKEDERKERHKEQAREKLAEELISVMDNLERAIMSADEDSTLLQGVKMVSDQLYETLEKKGLQRIDAQGEEFDPNIHNAVETRKHEEDRKVLEQKRPGYTYNEKVLRPAEVVVSESEDE